MIHCLSNLRMTELSGIKQNVRGHFANYKLLCEVNTVALITRKTKQSCHFHSAVSVRSGTILHIYLMDLH